MCIPPEEAHSKGTELALILLITAVIANTSCHLPRATECSVLHTLSYFILTAPL